MYWNFIIAKIITYETVCIDVVDMETVIYCWAGTANVVRNDTDLFAVGVDTAAADIAY